MKNEMEIAYFEAKKAFKDNEIPVGCVIFKDNKIIAKTHNNRQKKYDLFGHAEIIAIKKAERKLKDWRLDGCIMYVTLKPCDLCTLCIKKSRIDKVYYLIDQDSITSSDENFFEDNSNIILKEDYKELLTKFFQKLRK